MQCQGDPECPALYSCQAGTCAHQPLTYLCPQLLLAAGLVLVLAPLGNRIGASQVWLMYPVLLATMSYGLRESYGYIAPVLMGSGFVMLYLALRSRSETSAGPAVNFYVVNVTMPVLVVGLNIGLVIGQVVPLLYVCIVGALLMVGFLSMAVTEFRNIQAGEKISEGVLKKMLPSRLQNSRKFNTTIQMALIEQADSEYEQHQKQQSPTKKSKLRSQLISDMSTFFPLKQFLVCMLCFLGYECLCLSLPQIIAWLGSQNNLHTLLITYAIMMVLAVGGELYLYKFYVEPTIIQQEMIKLNLGLRMDWHKMMVSCAVGLVGGVLEGSLGFGFYFCMFLFLAHSHNALGDTVATCGFFNIFIAAVFSLNSIFCGQFHWLTYITVLAITLMLVGAVQYLLEGWLSGGAGAKSTLAGMLVGVMGACLASVLGALGLAWGRFGWGAVTALGHLPTC